jgi:hypothetical protein
MADGLQISGEKDWGCSTKSRGEDGMSFVSFEGEMETLNGPQKRLHGYPFLV